MIPQNIFAQRFAGGGPGMWGGQPPMQGGFQVPTNPGIQQPGVMPIARPPVINAPASRLMPGQFPVQQAPQMPLQAQNFQQPQMVNALRMRMGY